MRFAKPGDQLKKAAAAEKKATTITLGSSDVAKLLKIDAKTLRKHLRSINGKAPGTRYEFKESELPALRKLIEERVSHEETAKAAKKSTK
jgi:hypothetical protein